MSITIENPTAESVFEALKQLPAEEWKRLRAMLITTVPVVDESTEWSDEDLSDFSNAGAGLYEEIEWYQISYAIAARFFDKVAV
jgi:hypothetical protein